MSKKTLALLLISLAGFALSRPLDLSEHRAIQESLSRVHPRFRATWLKEHGVSDPYYSTFRKPDSGQWLTCIGRWSYGPSYDVDGRTTPTETLVALARGSGVSLIRFARTDSIEVEWLADVNAGGIMKRVAVRDSLLYVGSTAGLEIWSIADERNPVRRSWIATALNDFALQESLAYVIGPDDSFKVYIVADPASPIFRGACRDSGSTIAVTAGAAFIGDRWGLYAVDVTNPANPHRVGSWGSAIEGVTARGHLCYVTTFNPSTPGDIGFYILDVSTPSSPVQIGFLDQAGGMDVCLVDTLAFCSGDQYDVQFNIVSIADSTQPQLLGTGNTPGWNWGVWASAAQQAAFVADDWEGMQIFDVANVAAPVRDSSVLDAGYALDVDVNQSRAFVADQMAGLKIVSVQDPTAPSLLGTYDSLWQLPVMNAAVARDSFAYVGWGRPRFRSVDVSDPVRPATAGSCLDVANAAQDMCLRDTLVYIAENYKLHVVNVARPREPVVVGSCTLPFDSHGLDLEDSLTFVGNTTSLQIVNVARPSNPVVVGTWDTYTTGVDVVDTIAYVACSFGFAALNVANPNSPYVIDSLDTGIWPWDVVVAGNVAYVGTDQIQAVDISDPSNLRVVGQWSAPQWVQRLCYTEPFVYAACQDAGVCILDTLEVGIAEERGDQLGEAATRAVPSVTCGLTSLRAPVFAGARDVRIYTSTGSLVRRITVARPVAGQRMEIPVDLSGLPDGVYLLTCRVGGSSSSAKVVKVRGR
jgi:hypothetical protein